MQKEYLVIGFTMIETEVRVFADDALQALNRGRIQIEDGNGREGDQWIGEDFSVLSDGVTVGSCDSKRTQVMEGF